MSIYSGFATRTQQQAYDQLILDLVGVLQRRIIKFYVGEDADEVRFHHILLNISHHLAKMEENKYLDPKLAPTLRDLLSVTTAVAAQPQPPTTSAPALPNPPSKKPHSAPKQSLNFSMEKISQDLKIHAVGKIRHQATSKDDISSRDEPSNPEQVRTNSSLFGRDPTKPILQRWGAVYDEPPALPPDQERKNIQYIIREYVSRGQQRRRLKRKD